MEREFRIQCPKNKVQELKHIAQYLDRKMQEIQHGNKFVTVDHIAITAALNIAHELKLEKQRSDLYVTDDHLLRERLFAIKQKINEALNNIG
jgi:cell division protein ZapA